MLYFLRELSVYFSGDAKAVVKSGIGAVGLKVTDLSEDVVGVCGVEKETGEDTLSFTGILKNLSW